MRFLLLIAVYLFTPLLRTTVPASPYQEPWRPQFHFTPAVNWMNDPNGMVYYAGEYHLFYQYNPFGDRWGHMSWGHAVSRDLLHWEHLPVALEEADNIMIFSGSAVVDWKNTSGFGKNGQPPLVAIYTGHHTDKPRQAQHIAYSNDHGRSWTKYRGNPVLDIGESDFRDPKVFWHEPSKRWIMTVAWPLERKVRFYHSNNLKDWMHLSDFGPTGSTTGIWECPDLFELPFADDPNRTAWVLIVNVGSGAPAGGSGCQYFIGSFDGTTFTLDRRHPASQPLNSRLPQGRILADFEGNGFGDWIAEGDSFKNGPVKNFDRFSGMIGQGLATSWGSGDADQGTLTSPTFTLDGDYLTFLIGGGDHAGETCLNLIVSNSVVRSSSGNNSASLQWQKWNLSDLRGKPAQLQIVDRHGGGWGQIFVDHIVLGDTPFSEPGEPALWADWGRDFYAAVSWSDIPPQDGRRLWLGWMSNWQYANDVPTSPWRSAMSFPRELSLSDTPSGPRLIQKPVREIERLVTRTHSLKSKPLHEADEWLQSLQLASPLLDITLRIESAPATLQFITAPEELTLLHLDPSARSLNLDRTRSGETDFHPAFSEAFTAPLFNSNRNLSLHILIDVSSIEVFADNGETVITSLVLPRGKSLKLRLEALQDVHVHEIVIRELRPSTH